MAKPAFLSPGSVVRVTGSASPSENGATGYVRRTVPVNGDPVLVHLLDGVHKGTSLSFRTESLSPVE